MPIRILIADDHGVLRAGLRALLNDEFGMEVVGEAADGIEAFRLAESLKPDVILADISMPGQDGIQLTRQIAEAQLPVRVLILTVHEDKSLLREAIQAGASGYILKRAVETELTQAIHSVARGELYIHPEMTRALLKEQPPPVDRRREVTLTAREIEVLKLLAHGYTNRQIAEELNISVRTVESHRANLMSKLNLTNRVEMVLYARENGL